MFEKLHTFINDPQIGFIPSGTAPNFDDEAAGDFEVDLPELSLNLLTSTSERFTKLQGRHSSFQFLAQERLDSMRSQLIGDKTLLAFGNLSLLSKQKNIEFNELWTYPTLNNEQLEKLHNGIFPNSKVVYKILEVFDSLPLVRSVCNVETLTQLFEIYYSKQRKLSFSELLMMNMGLSCCILLMLNNVIKGNETYEHSNDDLVFLQSRFFSHSVYYYEKIRSNDGLRTVQGILLLIMFLENSWISTQITHTQLSIVIRYAQEIGINRKLDNSTNFGIWSVCEYLDIEISHRYGKNPIINPMDVKPVSDSQVKQFLDVDPLDISHTNKMDYFAYFMYNLFKSRYKAYFLVFSVQATKSFNQLSKIVKDLNFESEKMISIMDAKFRPVFYYDEEFIARLENISKHPNARLGFSFQFSYFHHIMTINRYLGQVNHPKAEPFQKLSLDCARTILYTMLSINKQETAFHSLYWKLNCSSAAYLTMLSFFCDNPHRVSIQDFELLADVLDKVFYSKEVESGSIIREFFYYVIGGVCLEICLKLVKSKTSFYYTTPKLENHFLKLQQIIPELYQSQSNYENQLYTTNLESLHKINTNNEVEDFYTDFLDVNAIFDDVM
ncbi:hypothetical protein CLIB1444_02S03708 [[Candida] jaroonii]|uniref:Uncharacterized protein n=1 Tax=[Candida] jaroonii TaxID=467808 RepID=A0ACA9Y372_9ASCO|nr:hypothetical protein CLIB1444_02S03708 [[Candida] jaroonii]